MLGTFLCALHELLSSHKTLIWDHNLRYKIRVLCLTPKLSLESYSASPGAGGQKGTYVMNDQMLKTNTLGEGRSHLV